MLSVGLVLSSFLLINKPTNSVAVDKVLDNLNGNNSREDNTWETGGMPILDALPVFYSNSTVKSMEEALAIFKQNLVTTEESTAEKLAQCGKPNDANIVDEIILFAQHATAERREWRNDQYWLLPNRTAYVLVVPAVSKHENWVENESKILVERINHPEGTVQSITLPTNAASFEDVKEYMNEKYPEAIDTCWTETKLWIKYLIDEDGTIYWAGQYLRSKPWLD